MRAIDLHSRHLVQAYGLTGPQILLVRQIVQRGETHAAELAQEVSLSHATVTDILTRLEQRALIQRSRSESDRRRIVITPTATARELISLSPPLLQEQFASRLGELQEWELTQILSVLQRVALMMDARRVDAAPLLATGSLTAEPDTVEQATREPTAVTTDNHEPSMTDKPSAGQRKRRGSSQATLA